MLDRRAMLLAILGATTATAASAQQLPLPGDGGGLFGAAGAVGGAGADAAGGLAGGLGGALGGGFGGAGAGFGGDQDAFRTAALQDGSYAIQTSQIALARSRNRDLRQFAQLEINEQVSIAAALGASAATPLPLRPDQARIVERLQNASGRTFDALYIQGQIAGHDELLSLNTAYAQDGQDLADRRVAVVAVPSIQTHLSILGRLQRRGA